jgi:hypothetical protein
LTEARCAVHRARVIGVVRRQQGGFESWEARIDGQPSGRGSWPWRDTTFVNLRETTDDEVRGWCRDCRTTRTVTVVALLAAAHSPPRPVVLA